MMSIFWKSTILVYSMFTIALVSTDESNQKWDTTLLAFDCSKGGIQTHPIDLLEVTPCPVVEDPPTPIHARIQLIQSDHQKVVAVQQCTVLVTSTLIRCGMYSHQMILKGPTIGNPLRISNDDCKQMITMKLWEYKPQTFLTNIVINDTMKFSDIAFGSLSSDGSCTGSDITVGDITYNSAFYLHEYTVTTKVYDAIVDSSSNSILLSNSLKCNYNEGSCFDEITGLSMWDQIDKRNCEDTNIYDIFCGKGTIILSNDHDYEDSVINVNDNHQIFFTSRIHKKVKLCNEYVYSTDYQTLYVNILNDDNKNLLELPQLPARFVQPLLYTNVKISYLQYKMYDNINAIYTDVINQLCKVEHQVLENKINMARLNGNNLQHLIGFGNRGTFLQVKGEVAHIIKCPIVPVQLRETLNCYNAIPVKVNNTDKFILPISRVIVDIVPSIICSDITPVMFQLGNQWVMHNPKYSITHAPQRLEPKTQKSMILKPIFGFEEGGIYSKSTINDFYKSLSEGSRRDAQMVHIMDNIHIDQHGKLHITNALSTDSWKAIMKENVKYMWGWLVGIGEWLSGFLAIYCILFLIKFVLNFLVRTFSLYQLNGCTWSIIGGISSWTYKLLKMNKAKKQKSDEHEMSTINIEDEEYKVTQLLREKMTEFNAKKKNVEDN